MASSSRRKSAARKSSPRRRPVAASPRGPLAAPVGYYRDPTVFADRVAFVADDDLWVVGTAGGSATRLTAGGGRVSGPRFSPDGEYILFAATYDGGPEAWVVPSVGGSARRLSHLGGTVRTVGWMPDGKRALAISNAAQPFAGDYRLYELPLAGGPAIEVPVGPVRSIAFEPNGRGRVLGLNTSDPARWKRYRGGLRGRLVVDRTGNGKFDPFFESQGNLSSPMWIGERIWFLSDHEGHANLYSARPNARDVERHTNHEGFYARTADTDGRSIVYHRGGDLWLFDIASNTSRAMDVRIPSPRSERMRRFVPGIRWVDSATLHPDGSTVSIVARGGIHTMSLWEGGVRRHGVPSAARYRLARTTADGKRMVATSDAGGEERLVVFAADGSGSEKRLGTDVGRATHLELSPAGRDRVALANHRHEVWLVDLTTGRGKAIARSSHHRIGGLSWSPDGRWLAYDLAESPHSSTIWLHDTRTGKSQRATDGRFRDTQPVFDPEGRYLAFLSARVFDPVYDNHYFDLGFPKGIVPCLIPLATATVDPFSSATRPPKPVVAGASPPPNKEEAKKKPVKKAGPTPTKIDLEGLASRVLAFPVPEGRYSGIAAAVGRFLFLGQEPQGSLRNDDDEGGFQLTAFDFAGCERHVFPERVQAMCTTADGRHLLLRAAKRLRVLAAGVKPGELSSEGEPNRKTGWLDVGRLRIEVDPALEWRQMFREAWRLQRDHFWSEDMADVDWNAVHDAYLPLVDRVGTRGELSDLLWEVQGELGTSHSYEYGGEYVPGRSWPLGRLGADFTWDAKASAWRIAHIPGGDSWNASSRSPLAAPGVDLAEGDLLLAVEGRVLDRATPPNTALVHRAEVDVVLQVRRGTGRPRHVSVHTLADEQPLRYRAWVERNRARVHRESKGRVGYVHVPDMGPRGFSEFHRAYLLESERDGLIVDVRYNGGGHVSQLLLAKLLRKRVGWDKTRWNDLLPYPDHAPAGPLVALTNEHAGSDGDIFSHVWKIHRLGPLIGRRTWGGVVGIWPRHSLVDGTVTTQPEFAHWFEDVGWGLENHGAVPDIEVDYLPQDYANDRDPQLDRGLESMKELLGKSKAARPLLTPRPSMKAPQLAPVLPTQPPAVQKKSKRSKKR